MLVWGDAATTVGQKNLSHQREAASLLCRPLLCRMGHHSPKQPTRQRGLHNVGDRLQQLSCSPRKPVCKPVSSVSAGPAGLADSLQLVWEPRQEPRRFGRVLPGEVARCKQVS